MLNSLIKLTKQVGSLNLWRKIRQPRIITKSQFILIDMIMIYLMQLILSVAFSLSCSKLLLLLCIYYNIQLFLLWVFLQPGNNFHIGHYFGSSWFLDCEKCDWKVACRSEMVEWFWWKRERSLEILIIWQRA